MAELLPRRTRSLLQKSKSAKAGLRTVRKILAARSRIVKSASSRSVISYSSKPNARSFPRDTCLRWSVLPFDKLSKSVMVATVNPYNKQAARELEAHTKNRIVFYLVSPVELMKILKKVHR